MKYHEILKALIGIPSLSARLDNPFPLVGDKVTISSTSEWVRQHEYLLDGGAGPERSVLDCVLGKSSETVDMSAAGEFIQSVSVSNDSGNASVRKIAYPMLPATEPYFMVTATEIVRVGERGYLSIYAENGYATSRNNTIVARIYKENEPEPVKTVGFDTSRPGPTVWAASPYTFDAVSDRGIYDVEVDVTDVLTGVTFTKRINKLITVTPALAPRDEAVEYLVPDAKIVGGAESWIIDGKDYPAGRTFASGRRPRRRSAAGRDRPENTGHARRACAYIPQTAPAPPPVWHSPVSAPYVSLPRVSMALFYRICAPRQAPVKKDAPGIDARGQSG